MHVGKCLCHLCTFFTKFSSPYAEIEFTLEPILVHFYTTTETRSQVNALVVGKSTRYVDV
jgi:hypothetical protein